MPIERGEVYIVDLVGAKSREIYGHKDRPVVVVSADSINAKPLVIAVIPGTGTPPPALFPNVVAVRPSRENGLREETYFLCHQIRALDHSRFTKDRIGKLSDRDLLRIDNAVRFSLRLA